jgi:hypothetical protein
VLTNFSTVIGSIVGVLSSLQAFTNGIQIGSTEKYPIGLRIGPLPPIPLHPGTNPGGTGGGSSVGANIYNTAVAVTQWTAWVASAASIVAAMSSFAALQREKFLSLMLILIPKKQYALQYNSHGFYDTYRGPLEGDIRRKVTETLYIDPVVQAFNANYQINNLNRSSYVAIELATDLSDPTIKDRSRYILSKSTTKKLDTLEERDISCKYAALKVDIDSQYGQLESIKQLPITSCVTNTVAEKKIKFSSDVLFGGDIYINRFTEKNTMFFFNDWLFDVPDEFEYDYTLYQNVPYARFWLTNTEYQGSDILSQASKWRALDLRVSSTLYVKQGYFYLFNSGVRDFFVESEANLAYRDWEDDVSKRHYDFYKYTDLVSLFRSDFIRAGNYYKYDYSLSVSKLYNNFVSWGTLLPRVYDPAVAETCYVYQDARLIYSLSQEDENIADNWRTFLANNYYDLPSRLTSVKKVNKTGALFMLDNQSPLQFMGVDQLQTDQGLKVTIGDGGLFNQALQNIVNADDSYEYGSCQNRFSVCGTKFGIFWVSQNQGKVFQYAGQLNEISDAGMKWWFAKYLPSEILKLFPNYLLYDNPVVGVGVQTIYDNIYELLYITKKDYKPIIDLEYDETNNTFYSDANGVKVFYELGNPLAFEDASWTISYDPKTKTWISFHDWHPTYVIPAKTHFMTVNVDSIWKHNIRCDSYCNFYGEDYPWEVEFVSSTGQTVTTMRSIEYLLEAYKYYNDCKDKFHILDRNFDQAIVHNSEQISGLLYLNIKPKNNPVGLLDYPSVNSNYIDILYSKEENKYRFNQFWDITNNRFEFSPLNLGAPTYQQMFITEASGYKFEINPQYINYNKSPLERKKFRHHVNKVFLRRHKSYDVKFLFKLSNQKIQPSYR